MQSTITSELANAEDTLTILNPRTGEAVGNLSVAGADDVAGAVAAARAAQPAWAATPPGERGRLLREAARALEAAAAELADLNAQETGRPVEEALAGIAAGVSTLEQYAELGPVHRGHSLRGNALAADYTVAEPRGVTVLLTPWNDPSPWPAGSSGPPWLPATRPFTNRASAAPTWEKRWGRRWRRYFRPTCWSR